MSTRALKYAFVMALSLLCQAALRAQAGPTGTGPMMTPPPVSGQSYRIETGLQERENYIRGGIGVGGGYVDNLYPGSTASSTGQVSEKLISLQPTIEFDTRSARLRTSAAYNPTFIFYQPTSGLNEADHSGVFDFAFQFTPRLNVDVNDTLLRTSSGFSQIGTGGISGSPQAPALIVGYAEHLLNLANASLSYQFSPHGMIGALGDVGTLNYANSPGAVGIYDSASRGGGAFYNHRISASQYIGAIYKYEQTFAYPAQGQYETQTNSIGAFYTIYLTQTFSLSVEGAPQQYRETHAQTPVTQSWTPSIAASMGLQKRHTSFAAQFSRSVTGGGGLLGAFYTREAGAVGNWQFARQWNAALNVDYTINKAAAPLTGLTSSSGHTFATALSLSRMISAHTGATVRYDRLQNRYDGIPSITNNPNSDRILASLFWDFQRPLGR